MSTPTTNDRIAAVRKHLDAYDWEGRTIGATLDKIMRLRERVGGSPLMEIRFGGVGIEGVAVPTDYHRDGSIVLGDPTHVASLKGFVVEGSARASEIAGPGLRACLLMWLAEWERKTANALDAWKGRDPLAEAMALTHEVTAGSPS